MQILACVVLGFALQDPPAKVTFASLLRDAISLDWLWQPPRAGERCVQFSSFDRASSKGPAVPAAWYANVDASQYLRVEERDGRREWVMVDADGPGAVVRVWSANPKGTLHFWFDREAKPSWSIAFQDLTGGKKEPFVEPLAGITSSGWNCHVPIPFGKHLKITCSEDGFYYHVNVRRWGPDVEVETFEPAMLENARADLEAIPKAWSSRPVTDGAGGRFLSVTTHVAFAADQPADVTLFEAAESGVLRTIQCVIVPAAGASDLPPLGSLLRGTRLVVELPGGREIVDVPCGDFFGSAPQGRDYRGFVMGFRRPGPACAPYCSYPMPLPAGSQVLLRGEAPAGGLDCILTCSRLFEPRELPANALYFHAAWHQVRHVKTRPFSDHLVLAATGPGRYVGTTLVVRNPVKGWWGEGDEKLWVDGDKFPSTFGTGTEDFFGYAWSSATPFAHALHALTQCDGPGHFGYTCANRWQILDSVPFLKSLRFDLEVWHSHGKTEVDYASTAYWYGPRDGASGLPAMPPVAERLPIAMEPPRPLVVAGALEGEDLEVVSITGGERHAQKLDGLGDGLWSKDAHVWWLGGKPGDRLTLAVPVAAAGTYRVKAVFTKATDYAIVQPSLGGTKLGAPIDLFAPQVEPTSVLDLGVVTLPAGTAPLVLEITGKNDKAVAGYMVGLDYLLLVK